MGMLVCKQKIVTSDQIEKLEDYKFTKINNCEYWSKNRSIAETLKKFGVYSVDYRESLYDFEKTFEKLGLPSFSNYEYYKSEDIYDELNDSYTFKYVFVLNDKESGIEPPRVSIDSEDMILIHIDLDTLLFEDIETFKGMYIDDEKDGFWNYTKLDDYDDKGVLHEDAIVTILNNVELEKLKKYFEVDAPIQKWSLEDDEIVYLSW